MDRALKIYNSRKSRLHLTNWADPNRCNRVWKDVNSFLLTFSLPLSLSLLKLPCATLICKSFVFTTFQCHLWSTTEQAHGNNWYVFVKYNPTSNVWFLSQTLTASTAPSELITRYPCISGILSSPWGIGAALKKDGTGLDINSCNTIIQYMLQQITVKVWIIQMLIQHKCT